MSGGEDRNIGGKWVKNIVPIIAIAILIALASVQTLSGQEANAGDVNASVQNISDQQPCDNVTQYLDVEGFIEPPYEVAWTYDLKRAQVGHDLKSMRIYHQGYDETGKRQITFVVDCETGEVYDHVPSFTELGLTVAEVKEIEIALNWNLSVTQDHLDQVEQSGAEVLNVKCRIDSYANRSQIEIIEEYEWVSTVGSPGFTRSNIPLDEKVWTFVRSNSSITSAQVDQVKQTGADVESFICWILADATNSQRALIGAYDWVLHASDGSDRAEGHGAIATPRKPKAFLLANSIDRSLASDFTAFLDNNGIEVVHVDASEFEQYTLERSIVILGGPDAPEGVGEIVQQVLNSDGQDHLRTKGNRRMYVKANPWRPHGGVVMVIAGSDRYETQKAHEENREQAHLKIMR